MKAFTTLAYVLSLVNAAAFEPREVTVLESRQTRTCKILGNADVNCYYCDRLDFGVVTVLNARFMV